MKTLACSLLVTLLALPVQASADEGPFLRSLQGNWLGKGTVKPRIGTPTINVTCAFKTKASGASLSLDGTCTGLVVMQRSIGASIRAKGARYSGTYIGPAGGRSALSGTRQGDSIRLAIRWSKVINGDRTADMVIEKNGSSGLTLSTRDLDPSTGKNVVTSEINLTRR